MTALLSGMDLRSLSSQLHHLYYYLARLFLRARLPRKSDPSAEHLRARPETHVKPEPVDGCHRSVLRFYSCKLPGKFDESVAVVFVHVCYYPLGDVGERVYLSLRVIGRGHPPHGAEASDEIYIPYLHAVERE